MFRVPATDELQFTSVALDPDFGQRVKGNRDQVRRLPWLRSVVETLTLPQI